MTCLRHLSAPLRIYLQYHISPFTLPHHVSPPSSTMKHATHHPLPFQGGMGMSNHCRFGPLSGSHFLSSSLCPSLKRVRRPFSYPLFGGGLLLLPHFYATGTCLTSLFFPSLHPCSCSESEPVCPYLPPWCRTLLFNSADLLILHHEALSRPSWLQLSLMRPLLFIPCEI